MAKLSELGLDKMKSKSHSGNKLMAARSAGIAWLYCRKFLRDMGKEPDDFKFILEGEFMRTFCVNAALSSFGLKNGESNRDLADKIASLDPGLRDIIESSDLEVNIGDGKRMLYGLFSDFDRAISSGLASMGYGETCCIMHNLGLLGGKSNEEETLTALKKKCARLIQFLCIYSVDVDGELVIAADMGVRLFDWYLSKWVLNKYCVYVDPRSLASMPAPACTYLSLGNLGTISKNATFLFIGNEDKVHKVVQSIMLISQTLSEHDKKELLNVKEELNSVQAPPATFDYSTLSEEERIKLRETEKDRRDRKIELEKRKDSIEERLKTIIQKLSKVQLVISPETTVQISGYFPEYKDVQYKNYDMVDFELLTEASMDRESFIDMKRTKECLETFNAAQIGPNENAVFVKIDGFIDNMRRCLNNENI